jgi:hypothetical protein
MAFSSLPRCCFLIVLERLSLSPLPPPRRRALPSILEQQDLQYLRPCPAEIFICLFESVVQVCLAWPLRSSSNIIVFLPSSLPSCDPSNTIRPPSTNTSPTRLLLFCWNGTGKHCVLSTLALLINRLPLSPAHAFASCEITNQDLLPERSPLPPSS